MSLNCDAIMTGGESSRKVLSSVKFVEVVNKGAALGGSTVINQYRDLVQRHIGDLWNRSPT